MSDLAVVIPAFNGAQFLGSALESVLAQTVAPRDVFVVDNASTDETAELVERDFPSVTLVRLAENSGFGTACNVGIGRALDAGADFVLLLNQDAKLHPDCLDGLRTVAESNPEVGILSPLQLYYDGSSLEPSFTKYAGRHCPELVSDALVGEMRDVYPLPMVLAAIWLLRSEMLREIGGFDPVFFMYGEDDDLAQRAREAGWQVGIAPAARAYHEHRGPSFVDRPPVSALKRRGLRYAAAVRSMKNGRGPIPFPLAWYTLRTLVGAVFDGFRLRTSSLAERMATLRDVWANRGRLAASRRGDIATFGRRPASDTMGVEPTPAASVGGREAVLMRSTGRAE